MSEYLKSFVLDIAKTPLYITLAGVTYPDPNYRIIRKNSAVSVIEYVMDGEGYVTVDGKTRHVCKDMIYFLHCGENHSYYADPNKPFTKIFLNVSGEMSDYIIMALGLSEKNFFDGQNLRYVFEKIIPVLSSDMPEFEMQASLIGIFMEIISRLSVLSAETGHCDEAVILKNYLDSNTGRTVSSSELCKLIFRSPDYCQKLFFREFNITPYAYQIEQKIRTAKILLAGTNMSVGEIAEKVGYEDIHYFSNLFRKKCGCSPSYYRKNNL